MDFHLLMPRHHCIVGESNSTPRIATPWLSDRQVPRGRASRDRAIVGTKSRDCAAFEFFDWLSPVID